MNREIILVNYTGQRGAGPIISIEMTRAFLKNGEKVIAIISKDVANIGEWRALGLEKLIEIQTFTTITELIVSEIVFHVKEKRKIVRELRDYYIKFIYCPMISPRTRQINNLFKQIKVCAVNHDPIPHSGDKGTLISNFFGMQKIYRDADQIMLHSKQFIEYVEKKYHKKNRVFSVPLGIHHTMCVESDIVKYDEDKINFLFFGRIEDYKGLHVLAKAYKKLENEYDNVALYVVGSGDFSPYEKEYKQIKTVTIINRWIGDEEVGNFFRAKSLILVLPYIDATQSGPITLALEYHVPCIASDAGGMSEQIRDGETGILVQAGDSESLYQAMKKITDSSSLRMQLVSGCEELIDEIAWEKSARTIMKRMSNKEI